jgi:hypothetical protein
MNPKEKIKYFNQNFMTLLNRIPEDSQPPTNVILEFYTTALLLQLLSLLKEQPKPHWMKPCKKI